MDLSKPQKFDRKDCLHWKFIAMIILHFHLHVIYQTRATVFHRDIQTPRRELKIRRAAEYF